MEFFNRVKLLKLVGWEVSTTDKTAHFKFNDGIHLFQNMKFMLMNIFPFYNSCYAVDHLK